MGGISTHSQSLSGRSELRLLHASDLHVGSDVLPDEAIAGFRAVVRVARDVQADALLIAGDLFDHQGVDQELVEEVLTSLAGLPCPTVVLPGNHDTLLTQDRRYRLNGHVSVIVDPNGETVRLADLRLAVWGRPVIEHSPAFRPLATPPSRPDDDWFVVMAHGLFIPGRDDIGFSSPITPEDLALLDCDYVALGHVHAFRKVADQPSPAYYSGSPFPSATGTVALVQLDQAAAPIVTPIPITNGSRANRD